MVGDRQQRRCPHRRHLETYAENQLYTDFEGTMNADSGKTVAIRHKPIEVLRCQPDGTWKLIVGDLNGPE